jgi:hypothetical protein
MFSEKSLTNYIPFLKTVNEHPTKKLKLKFMIASAGEE